MAGTGGAYGRPIRAFKVQLVSRMTSALLVGLEWRMRLRCSCAYAVWEWRRRLESDDTRITEGMKQKSRILSQRKEGWVHRVCKMLSTGRCHPTTMEDKGIANPLIGLVDAMLS